MKPIISSPILTPSFRPSPVQPADAPFTSPKTARATAAFWETVTPLTPCSETCRPSFSARTAERRTNGRQNFWANATLTSPARTSEEAGQKIKVHHPGVSRSEQRRYFVEPSRFTTLKRGGANHNFQVESIVYNGGHRFPTGAPGKEELLPYKMITFNQK